MRIIDDDAYVVRPKDSLPLNPLDDDEEQPTVVEIIDERPQHIRDLEMYQKSSQWKALGTKNTGSNIKIDFVTVELMHNMTFVWVRINITKFPFFVSAHKSAVLTSIVGMTSFSLDPSLHLNDTVTMGGCNLFTHFPPLT